MAGDAGRVRQLRTDAGSLERILDRLDGSERRSPSEALRASKRWGFRAKTAVLMLGDAKFGWHAFRVATRNLSTGGIGVLHDGFVHAGTPCLVGLKTLGGRARTVRGSVVRCRHLSGSAHEVGVGFDSVIEPSSFIALSEITTIHTERVEPESLSGRVLMIDGSAADAAVLRRALGETGVRVTAFGTLGEALASDLSVYELAVIDGGGEGAPGAEFIEPLRDAGLRCGVIMTASGADASMVRRFAEAGAELFIPKPLSRRRVLCGFADFLSGSGRGSMAAESGVDVGCALDPAFFERSLAEVRDAGQRVMMHLARNELKGLLATAGHLQRTADHIGLPAVSELSVELVGLLECPKQNRALIESAARRLRNACSRVRPAA